MSRLPVLLNSQAGGRAGSGVEEVRAAFAALGISADVRVPEDGEVLAALARGYAAEGCPVVVVGGGDGTLHTAAALGGGAPPPAPPGGRGVSSSLAAAALVGTSSALGVLPLGTFNHFALDLGLPLDLAGAAAVIAAGVVRTVDVGEANGLVFLNNACVGLYPRAVRVRDGIRHRLGRSKRTAVALAAWHALRHFRLWHVRVRAEGQDLVRKTPLVFVGCNVYEMESLDVGRRTSMEGGMLCLYVPRCDGPLRLVRLFVRGILGRLRRVEDFEAFTAESLRLETRRPREHVALDGEVVVLETPILCRIRPRALRVIGPAA